MASFRITFLFGNSNEGQIYVVGKKIPNSTLNQWYGKDHNMEVYRLHKNEYGIVWLTMEYNRRFDSYFWSIADDPSKATRKLPKYTKLIVTKL